MRLDSRILVLRRQTEAVYEVAERWVARYSVAMIDWSSCPVVERDPQRVSGAWVFRGTRVPVSALFQNLEDGAPLQDFIAWFPGVTTEQARAVLEHAARSSEAA